MAPKPSHLMDAGRALADGAPLRALALVGRDETAQGLLLRGIAYAQMGDYELATRSLERARGLPIPPKGRAELRARARAALVEIALHTGDPSLVARESEAAAVELTKLGDTRNATLVRLVFARAHVLLGQLGEARRVVDDALATELPPDVRAMAHLARAEVAVRSVAALEARAALADARSALAEVQNPLLARALVALEQELSHPVARIVLHGVERTADLFGIEGISSGSFLLVDDCRRLALAGRVTVPLARRPILFVLLLALARAWPDAVPRDELASLAFETKRPNASHRARLRVEIGRLRKILEGVGDPVATTDGYRLESKRDVALLLPLADDDEARLSILLGDGAAWSAQSLADHAGVSKRTAQRVLRSLVDEGRVVVTGSGKTLRYARPGSPLASRMLLLSLVPRLAPRN